MVGLAQGLGMTVEGGRGWPQRRDSAKDPATTVLEQFAAHLQRQSMLKGYCRECFPNLEVPLCLKPRINLLASIITHQPLFT